MTPRLRIVIATTAALISLPAFLNGLVISAAVYMMAVLGGLNATPFAAALNFLANALRSPATLLTLIGAIILVIFYWILFVRVLIGFVRHRRIPRWIQVFCLLVVLGVVGEALRLELTGHTLAFWYGASSVPSALALLTLLFLQARYPAGCAKNEHPGLTSVTKKSVPA